jgi:DNA-binding transcriptional regulator YdaS (Cro superfamily)
MDAIKKAVEVVGGQALLSRMLGVKTPTVNQWVKGFRPVPVGRCAAIERATGGAVTRRDLRPDDFHLIWPDLAEQEASHG